MSGFSIQMDMNRRTMTIPRHLVQSESIPEEATVELVIEHGRVRKLVAMTDESQMSPYGLRMSISMLRPGSPCQMFAA